MKKRTAKKGFPIRLLAVLLCCFCLIAALPTYALEDGTQVTETQNNTPVPGDNEFNNTSNDGDNTLNNGGDEQNNNPGGDDGGQNNTSNDGVNTANLNQENNQQNQDDQQNNQEEQQNNGAILSFFDKLTSCTTCAEMAALLDAADLAEVEALGDDELTILIDYATSLPDDDCKEELIYDLIVLRDGEVMDLKPGDGFPGGGGDQGGGSSGGATAVQTGYNGNNMVAYDIMINKTGQNDNTKLVSIKLGDIDVPHGDSTSSSYYDYTSYYGYTINYGDNAKNGQGNKLSTYYGDLTYNQSAQTRTLTITPAEGYYVTNVVIPCCNGGVPSQCAVWQNSTTIFSQPFTLATGRQVSIDVPSSAFGHYTSSNKASQLGYIQYFIMVVIAPIPTPTFVEYDYGTIVELGGSEDIFNDPVNWTNIGSGNSYGTTTEPDTNYTQYRYTHTADKPEEAASWKHTANSVTEAAKNNAASLGYYFAGWKATYYTDCTASQKNRKTGNNYKYAFSGEYNTINYAEGANVEIFSHVQLVAQWKTIELNVTKTVTGLADTDFESDAHTYKIQVQKKNNDGQWLDFGEKQSLTVTGDGSATVTLSPITPGTYRAVEVDDSRDNLTKDGKTMYVTVTDSGEVTYGTTPGATTQTLTVTNVYTATAPAYNLTIKKTVSGNLRDWSKEFEFTVNINGTSNTYKLKHNGTKTIENVPVGTKVTVTENPDGYTFSVVTGEGGTTVTGTTDSEKYSFTFTMPAQNTTVVFNNNLDAKIETGIILDALPYILILAIVAGGVVLMLLRRRRSYED